MICKKCGAEANELYRNGPKGIKVEFLCINCVSPEFKPVQNFVNLLKKLDEPGEIEKVLINQHGGVH